jgi:GNAT superfamily N-acetyltransferase
MPAGYLIRTASPEDSDPVQSLLEASYPTLFRPFYSDEALAAALPLMTKANPRLLASGNYFVAETGTREIVGCGGWSHERPGSGALEDRLGHVRHFATHPDWVRKGIGRALLARSIETARAEGIKCLECNSSLAAEAFYRALGFETVGPVDVDMGGSVRFPGIIMQMAL